MQGSSDDEHICAWPSRYNAENFRLVKHHAMAKICMGHQHTRISLPFHSEESKVVLSHSHTTQCVLPCPTQGSRCTMWRFPARQQPARGRRGGRVPGRTDLPSCSRTEATAGPASWTSPTASPWPSRGASHCQVSQHRSRLLMLHLCMLHFGRCILICANGRRHRHCQMHAGSLGQKMVEAVWKAASPFISQSEPCVCYAVLQANWLGDSREAWQERISAAAGASLVGSLLRKHGLPQRLSEALCAELGLEARRCAKLCSFHVLLPCCIHLTAPCRLSRIHLIFDCNLGCGCRYQDMPPADCIVLTAPDLQSLSWSAGWRS